tara:strand:+ start:194 stop:547 length:354 start_codon:yes stop_codon:yes gene_type:complete
MKKYKFCFDLDGTICEDKLGDQTYEDLKPIQGSVEIMQKLKKEGHYLIIYTARNMVTYNNNLGKIIANQSKVVIDWLEKFKIPYDELHFGKPVADFYIDDKGYKLESWNKFYEDLQL